MKAFALASLLTIAAVSVNSYAAGGESTTTSTKNEVLVNKTEAQTKHKRVMKKEPSQPKNQENNQKPGA